MWWLSIPIIVLCLIGLNAYTSGRELREDIEKGRL
ncbi:hypothetical protein ES708_15748 [subsurface metagenome]